MNNEPDPILLLKQLDRACRVGFLVLTAFFAYFALRLAWNIPNYEAIFKDMLNGKPLPLTTQMVLSCQQEIIPFILSVSALALGLAMKVRRSDHAVMGVSLCSLVLFLIILALWSGLTDPFMEIISQLTAGV